MKALTVRQPWAWAIFNGGKDVENRGFRPISLARGERIAIHSSMSIEGYGDAEGAVRRIMRRGARRLPAMLYGHVIGTVRVLGWVDDSPSPWAQSGKRHWLLDDPQPLAEPIEVRGSLGLWTLPREAEETVVAQT